MSFVELLAFLCAGPVIRHVKCPAQRFIVECICGVAERDDSVGPLPGLESDRSLVNELMKEPSFTRGQAQMDGVVFQQLPQIIGEPLQLPLSHELGHLDRTEKLDNGFAGKRRSGSFEQPRYAGSSCVWG